MIQSTSCNSRRSEHRVRWGSVTCTIDNMDSNHSSDLMGEQRPKCAGCAEPLELACPDDPESWIHAADANYFGDHTAWLEEPLS
jgi:hypothetical protein